MIHYQLRCKEGHAFDGWFKDSATFDKQASRKLVECPECGETSVERALMAPAVSTRRGSPPMPMSEQAPDQVPDQAPAAQQAVAGKAPAKMLAMLQRMRAEIEKHCDYVGPDFAEEARRIHRGEVDQRPIYGEASDEQTERLEEEGISVARIPWVPRADG